MSTGNASPAREPTDMATTKCGRLIYVFSQCPMVLRCGLQYGSDEGCMVFMHEDWLIFMQGVW